MGEADSRRISRVGIIGTGAMGRPVIDRLRAAGYQVSAFARRPDVASELTGAGVDVAESIPAVAKTADVVLIYVYSDPQVHEVAFEGGLIDAMAPGSTVVIHTTGSPRTAEALAERASTRGVGTVDAPGSGGPAQIAAGTLTLFAGGSEDDVERCRPVLETYASRISRVGGIGSGQMVKLVNNLLFGAQVELATQACELSRSFGIDPSLLATTLHGCSGASYALDLIASAGSPEALVASAGRYIHKDVEVALALADDMGAPLGAFNAITSPLLARISSRPEPATPSPPGSTYRGTGST